MSTHGTSIVAVKAMPHERTRKRWAGHTEEQKTKIRNKLHDPSQWAWTTAQYLGMKPSDVKAAVVCAFRFAGWHAAKSGSCKLAGMIKLQVKDIPAKPGHPGLNPFTKASCMFKAKPSSKSVRITSLTGLKKVINKLPLQS